MSPEQLLLVMTTVLAVIALVAAFIAVRAARRAGSAKAAPVDESPSTGAPLDFKAPLALRTSIIDPPDQVVAIVEGRVIVAPTPRQIVDATMNRPLVRVSLLSHGLAHALRPESRDKIMGLMRREFQSRRRQRKRAARQAARIEHPTPARSIDQSSAVTEAWLGELPAPTHAPTGQVES